MTKKQTKPTPIPAMNFREYWDEVGTDNIEKMIAGINAADPSRRTSMAYFRMLRYGIKIPGNATALLIVEQARQITPGFEPNLELLLRGVPRSGEAKSTARRIQPSERFLASQGAKS